ncbi:adenylate cyclase-like protein [Leptomonas pyrrhocoris]|uniref:Adenylate cyclase-like protein n=1 Tax=Leptomonas pyrrhocoris TaxID=157538 RepID=A0A0M9FQ30_LEPPY|nr:adenylate cyclase-like protein [Leptomonas pyrrhocoris]KPA73609.1 adenylate cyclase-like protein [Leptomonas pyrrhocoris]|eukprot:XP_015652048.1 adenylate cyclase-like protein [Leptomonas pyrrhocoris]
MIAPLPPPRSTRSSRGNTEAFETASQPRSRCHTRRGNDPTRSEAQKNGSCVAEGGRGPAAVPHTYPSSDPAVSMGRRDVQEATPPSSGAAPSSSVRTLRGFLQRHSMEAVASDGPRTAARMCFTAEERKEVEKLLADLQLSVSPLTPSAESTLPSSAVLLKPTRRSCSLTSPPSTAPFTTTATEAMEQSACPPPIPELQRQQATPMSPRRSLADRPRTHSITNNGSTVDVAAAAASAMPGRSSAPSDASITAAAHASVEGRYKEALKTVEGAASDRQLALKRVEEYCASLYTLVETWMHLHEQRFDEFTRTVLQRMLDDNPAYRVLFYDVDLSTQSLIIMDMIGRAVVAFTRPADLMDIMGEMGARHNLYGLRESHYVAMRNAFLKVYAEFVGPATYKESVAVWKMFWKTTVELAVSGASSERGEIYAQRRYKIWAARMKTALQGLIPLQCSGGFHRLMQVTY